MYNVFSDAESVVVCCWQRVAVSLLGRHNIRTQDCRLSQPQPQKHSGNHGARHEGSSVFTVFGYCWIYNATLRVRGL